MKDMGELHYFLGIQVQFHESGLFLSQQKYTEDLLAVSGMSNCSPIATPLPTQPDRYPDHTEAFENPTYFRNLAGKLQYLTLTRPDLQYTVNYVCQKMQKPSTSDFLLLKRILRYIRGTTAMGISFTKHTDSTLCAYSDSDWAGCKLTRRSKGGFCTFLRRNLISWSSRKQPTMSKSSTEAEYRTMSDSAQELTWISFILKELGIPLLTTPKVFCDNLSAIYLTANPAFHSKMKHFELDHHYVRKRVSLGALEVKHISASSQTADIFTKSLPVKDFSMLRSKLGVSFPPTPSLRGNVTDTEKKTEIGTHTEAPSLSKQWKQKEKSQEQDKSFRINKVKANTPMQSEGYSLCIQNENTPIETEGLLYAEKRSVRDQKAAAQGQKHSRAAPYELQVCNRFDVLRSNAVPCDVC